MSDRYGLLGLALSFPTEQLEAVCRSGALADSLDCAAGLCDPAATRTALEEEYIRLFDLPAGGPSCPLYTGVYAHSRREAMEELLRFYRHAGLGLSDTARDLPDAVPTVLEFLGFLAWREEASPEAAAAARRAAADVLHRHLAPWLEETQSRLPRRKPGPFYPAVLDALALYAAAELERVGTLAQSRER
jgi:DMSO reductase family type II enzyme chaperone